MGAISVKRMCPAHMGPKNLGPIVSIDVMMNTDCVWARLDNCSIHIFNNTNCYDILHCQLDFLEPWSHDQIQTHQWADACVI